MQDFTKISSTKHSGVTQIKHSGVKKSTKGYILSINRAARILKIAITIQPFTFILSAQLLSTCTSIAKPLDPLKFRKEIRNLNQKH